MEIKKDRLIKYKFLKFLKKKGCYDSFRTNLEGNGTKIKTYLNRVYAERYIFNAFTWYDTKEGSRFWDRMDTEWNEYLKDIRAMY